MDTDTAAEMLSEASGLAEGPVADSFVDGDRNPPVFDPKTHSPVITGLVASKSRTTGRSRPGLRRCDGIGNAAVRETNQVAIVVRRILEPQVARPSDVTENLQLSL